MKQSIQYRALTLLQRSSQVLNNSPLLQCIRESFMMIVPIIMLGAFALVFRSFPIEAYQTFITTFNDGIFYSIFDFIYQATFGALSIHMTVGISLAYVNLQKNYGAAYYGPVLTSLFCYFILSGLFFDETLDTSLLGVSGLFTAIVASLCSTSLYHWFQKRLRISTHFHTVGADETFHNMFLHLFPTMLTTVSCVIFHLILTFTFHTTSFQALYFSTLSHLFGNLGAHLKSVIIYELAVHTFWFFGIHGGNVMHMAHTNFTQALDQNIALIEQGLAPTEIFSKSFLDTFILMGGCGTTLCLILAILLFSKKNSSRRLAWIAFFPNIFNINELMLFGLPIVFNPIFFLPFFLVPLTCLFTSTVSTSLGLVPIVTHQTEWTTPVLLSGYLATGSIAGSILQLVNIVLGIFIYRPFVMLQDREQQRNSQEKMKEVVSYIQKSEQSRIPLHLLSMKGTPGMIAKLVADDLSQLMKTDQPTLFYQPQYDQNGHCIGAEALFRWKHPVYGMLYPPLVIQVAEEDGTLLQLEEDIFLSVIRDMDRLTALLGRDTKISINVTGTTIQRDEYEKFLLDATKKYPAYIHNIWLEITEQAALLIDECFIERLSRITAMGYRLAIDDFSMGNTSIRYLQSSNFSMLKLDGSLSRDVLENSNSQDIVASITDLSRHFHIEVLAEYVETEEQRQKLESLGCNLYQGYLYSPAISLDALEKKMQQKT